jgi:hypothetical protein
LLEPPWATEQEFRLPRAAIELVARCCVRAAIQRRRGKLGVCAAVYRSSRKRLRVDRIFDVRDMIGVPRRKLRIDRLVWLRFNRRSLRLDGLRLSRGRVNDWLLDRNFGLLRSRLCRSWFLDRLLRLDGIGLDLEEVRAECDRIFRAEREPSAEVEDARAVGVVSDRDGRLRGGVLYYERHALTLLTC